MNIEEFKEKCFIEHLKKIAENQEDSRQFDEILSEQSDYGNEYKPYINYKYSDFFVAVNYCPNCNSELKRTYLEDKGVLYKCECGYKYAEIWKRLL